MYDLIGEDSSRWTSQWTPQILISAKASADATWVKIRKRDGQAGGAGGPWSVYEKRIHMPLSSLEPGKWTEAPLVSPDVQVFFFFKWIRFWALIFGNKLHSAVMSMMQFSCSITLLDTWTFRVRTIIFLFLEMQVARFWLTRPSTILETTKGLNQMATIVLFWSCQWFILWSWHSGTTSQLRFDRSDLSNRQGCFHSWYQQKRSQLIPLWAASCEMSIILDCCQAGGAVRSFFGSDTNAIRYIPPNSEWLCPGSDEAADNNPRRKS